MKKTKIISAILITLLASFSLATYVFAQANQTASVSITSGNITMTLPDTINFERTFLPTGTSTKKINEVLNPANPNERIEVQDMDSIGTNFNVTMSISNLIDTDKVLPFTDFSLVTLATDTADNVDEQGISPNSSTVQVDAPNSCTWDAQNGTLEDNCSTELDTNTLLSQNALNPTDPSLPLTATETTLTVNDSTFYAPNEIIIFNNGEKALIIEQSGTNTFTIRRGILGTNATSHTASEGITTTGTSSAQITLLTGPEPVSPRVGVYSVGLGVRATLNAIEKIEEGSYAGTITFSLILS